ncbi:hypothetical protein L7F22_044664 [Adiantum nelumboides]|nr:hypothetical protein [Adiantum nelumboides]
MIAKDGKPGYLVVEILVDFKEQEGVQVCQLAKLNGYKTLCQRRTGEEQLGWISILEMRKFSRQIPAYQLTSDQVPEKKTACWDPASTPLELLSCLSQEMPEKNKETDGGPWHFCGLLQLFDPSRHDCAETIRRALNLGVNVKMLTGDQLAIAKETGRRQAWLHCVPLSSSVC